MCNGDKGIKKRDGEIEKNKKIFSQRRRDAEKRNKNYYFSNSALLRLCERPTFIISRSSFYHILSPDSYTLYLILSIIRNERRRGIIVYIEI